VQSVTDKAKSEVTVAWTLQSTQQIETVDPDLCNKYANKITALVDPVATMTVRAYCLCPFSKQVPDPRTGKLKDECLEDPMKKIQADTAKFTPGIEVIGPKSALPSSRVPSSR
jgi:hypothetical protein